MEGTNLSLSVHLELTFSITIKIKLCLSGDAGVSVKEKFYREAKVQKLLNWCLESSSNFQISSHITVKMDYSRKYLLWTNRYVDTVGNKWGGKKGWSMWVSQ